VDPSPAITATPPWAALVAVAVAIVLVGVGVAWWLARRRAAAALPARLRQVADDLLAGVLLTDAEAGQVHVEYALLTRAGIVVVDVRDVAGNVFGSETMNEWTVLAGSRRATFTNPLPFLYDRVAAVRRIVPELPVRGVVAFTGRAQFTKGMPPKVAPVGALLAELAAERETVDGPPADQLAAGWAALRAAASTAPA